MLRFMKANQWSFRPKKLEIDNLIQSEPPEKKLRSTKSLPQDDAITIDQEIQRKLVKKKKKAKFELPHPNVVKSLPRATASSNSKRLQRRISADFVPIFADNIDVNTNQLTPETTKTSTTSFKTKKTNSCWSHQSDCQGVSRWGCWCKS